MARLITILFLFMSGLTLALYGQEPVYMPGGASDIGSFWAMAKLGGWIGYVIMGVLALGLFLIVYKALDLFMDRRASRKLRLAVFPQMGLDEIESMTSSNGNSLLSETLGHLIQFYRAGGRIADIHQELVVYINQENEHFETFRGWLNFLSDSAGALGLLGTVWGVFLTFFGGSLDSEKILNGMGVALITTLLGLVVSLIINLFNTQISSLFQRQLEAVTKKADELRFFLLQDRGERVEPQRVQEPVRVKPPAAAPEKPAVKTAPPAESVSRRLKLRVLKSPNSELSVGETLKGAFQFQVNNASGEAAAGVSIHIASEGAIILPKGDSHHKTVTDRNGRAVVDCKTADTAGSAAMLIWLEGQEDQKEKIALKVKAGEPEKLHIAGGNDQFGTANTILPEPFKVVVTDRFGNRVTGAPVQFSLTMGAGEFQGGNHQYLARTNLSGLAESRLKLGNKTGFHTVEAKIKGNGSAAVEFRILSRHHAD